MTNSICSLLLLLFFGSQCDAHSPSTRKVAISAAGDVQDIDPPADDTISTIRSEVKEPAQSALNQMKVKEHKTTAMELGDQSDLGSFSQTKLDADTDNCAVESQWSKDCKCKVSKNVDPSCKDCKDQFGFCDPAQNGAWWGAPMRWWQKKNAPKKDVKCTTTTNAVTGNTECKSSFLGDFQFNAASCLCYEQAVNAPKDNYGKDKGDAYDMMMMNASKRSFGSMYKNSELIAQSCSEQGFHYDKKVHPCYRHGYSVFKSKECQTAFRDYRQQEYEEEENKMAKYWNKMVGSDSKLAFDLSKFMFAGGCNTGI